MVRLALPVLDGMLNLSGTAYAADQPIETRFVLWFNGNGIPERYWIPAETGPGYRLTPCLSPLAPFRNDIHVISGLDNPAARISTTGNEHHRAMSGFFRCCLRAAAPADRRSITCCRVRSEVGRAFAPADRRLSGIAWRQYSP
jgi:hypothetical protein